LQHMPVQVPSQLNFIQSKADDCISFFLKDGL